jgi:holo-[acyl-carrier protein] synthase
VIPPQLPPGGLLIGIGADLCEVARIREVNTRQGDRFLEKVFTAEEIAYCRGLADPAIHFAARFAAKEAVAKAFTTGIGADFGLHSVSVRNGERGEPLAVLDEQGQRLLRQVGGTHVLLTLTHTETLAMAVAAIIRVP